MQSFLRGITYQRGEVYVLQDKIHSKEELDKAIIHELYGHVGLKSLFGREIYARLNRLSLSLGNAKIAKLIEKYQLDKTGYVDYASKLTGNDIIVRLAGGTQAFRNAWLLEEALAHIAENETGTLKQRALELIGQIRAWLRDHGFMALSELGMTDIAHIL